MVHNGIEYGDMQLICEAYGFMKYLFLVFAVGDLLKNVCVFNFRNLLGLDNEALANVFEEWNKV
jgi:6-phosphogluconate dehydrogenase